MLLTLRPRRLRFAVLVLAALALTAAVVARAGSQTGSAPAAFDAETPRFTLAVIPTRSTSTTTTGATPSR